MGCVTTKEASAKTEKRNEDVSKLVSSSFNHLHYDLELPIYERGQISSHQG